MSIQKGFASALRLIRVKQQLTQKDISTRVTGSHVSQLESGKTSPTLKMSSELAVALGVQPSALLAVAFAAERGVTPREILNQAMADLERLSLLDSEPPECADATASPHPTTARAAEMRASVLSLKAKGLSQAEVSREMGVPTSTVNRHWHAEG
ncbi:helix-turn-helix domain-containing protein [Pseudomonas sp. ICMP 561]|uniref:helix-turn-helix domain-containing protein n=1 Tax=Pseudomonas sp. ICMP 561 TaxID=1718918 RepID=UPI000C0890A8|nr:helix-turn-helix domain-containing protein [Pseudomonas sp. ICMP 561]PHN17208.1 Fis family transcriptional regulator [Pseudomonas sp. ICMP 561]